MAHHTQEALSDSDNLITIMDQAYQQTLDTGIEGRAQQLWLNINKTINFNMLI